jgi:hypothetical protein
MIGFHPISLNQKNNPMQIQTHNMNLTKEFNSRKVFNIIYNIVYYLFVLVLVLSGISKLYNPFSLLENMRLSLPFPTLVLVAIVAFLASIETLIGLFLLFRLKVKENLIIISIMALFSFVYTIFCFSQKVPVESGFFGGFIECPFNLTLVIANSVFLFIVIALIIKEVELPD